MLSCVQVAALRWADSPSKESCRPCKDQETEKAVKVQPEFLAVVNLVTILAIVTWLPFVHCCCHCRCSLLWLQNFRKVAIATPTSQVLASSILLLQIQEIKNNGFGKHQTLFSGSLPVNADAHAD
jgi:hypothetical protein